MMKFFDKIFNLLLGISLILCSSFALAQSQVVDQIEASQGLSSPLIYTVANKDIPNIEKGSFYNEKECSVRNGTPNFLSKIDKKEDVTVAFIGGSITQGEYCYRLQISKYLESVYSPKIKWINAGISGTGCDLGAFRIDEQVLQYRPDLVFIEFAVNGGYPDGMEGMIRKIIKANPQTDICLLYTIHGQQTVTYQNESIPLVIKELETIAQHYSLPSIHLGMEAAYLEKKKKLLWKGTRDEAADMILFSHDGVHPIKEGGNLYAASLARGMDKMSRMQHKATKHPLPKPLITDNWDNAGMYLPVEIAKFDSHWTEIYTNDSSELKGFNGWFNTLMTSNTGGSSFTFKFEGDMFGLFDIGGPEVGQIEVFVDGKLVKLQRQSIVGAHLFTTDLEIGERMLNRFNVHCNNRYRGQYDAIELQKGIHEVTIRIALQKADKKTILGENQQGDITKHPYKYDQSVLYLGRILLRGKPLDKPKNIHSNVKQLVKWEQKFDRYAKMDHAHPPQDSLILFVGSSTVENWKSLSDDFPNKNVLNRGVSGTRTIDLYNYRERVIYPYQAKQIFVYEGDNDIGFNWSPKEILAQFENLFFTIRREKPSAQIVFISIKPSPTRMKNIEQISETNALIKKFINQQQNTDYADVFTPAFDPKGELYPEHYREDGLHLTAEGYKVWKEVISKYIK